MTFFSKKVLKNLYKITETKIRIQKKAKNETKKACSL